MTTEKETPKWLETRFGALLVLEFIALLISLAMPITPSKTGGDNDLAKYFIEDPSYIEKVFVAFIMTNLLFVVIALIAFVAVQISKRRKADQ